MVISKIELLKLVDALPDTIQIDDLIYVIWLQAKISCAEEAIREDRTLPHAELMAEVQQWRTQ
jgi:hypothetical protein